MEHKSRVLVVDDEAAVRDVLGHLLAEESYHLAFAVNGAQALAQATELAPDLILLDVMLPDVDGFEVCRRLRKDPLLAQVPIVMVTALDDPDARLQGLEAGADDFVSKPFDSVELLAKVGTITRLNRYRRLLEERTRRKEIEEALRESETRYRLISELISDYAYAFHVEPHRTLVLEWVTEAFSRITGFSPAELDVRGGWASLIHPDDLPIVARRAEALVSGQPDVSEFRIVTKSGEVRWLRDHGRPIWDETEGRVVGIVGAAQDITKRKRAEEGLRQSEERFRRLYERAPLGYQSLDADGRFLDVNEAWLDLLGYSRQEVIGRWFGDFLAPHEVAAFRARFQRFVATGEAHVDFEMVQRAGSTISVHIDGRIGIDEHGQFKQTHCILHSITERQRAEKALQESEERYRSLFEGAEDHIFVLDREFRYVMVNPSALNAGGFAPEDIVGKGPREVFPGDAEFYLSQYRQAFETGLPVRFERELRLPDGSHWFSVTLSPIKDGRGGVIALTGISRDITERKRMEQVLQANQEELAMTLDATTEGTWKWDFVADNLVFSPRYYTMLGYEPDEFPASFESWVSLLHPDDVQRAFAVANEYLATKPDVYENEFRLRTKEGDYRWIRAEARVVARDEQGMALRMIGNHRDITERKRAEAALRQRASQLALLNEIGAQVASLLDVDQVLDRAAHLVQERFGYHHVGLFVKSAGQDRLVMRARAGEFASLYPADHNLALGEGMVGWVGQHGETLLANDVEADLHYVNRHPDRLPTRAELSVPIRIGDEIVGVLDLQSPQAGAFDPSDVTTNENLANWLAVAIQNARQFQEIQQQIDELGLLFAASVTFSISLDLGTVLETTTRQITAALNAEGCTISFWDREQDALVTMLDHSPDPVLRKPDPPGTCSPLADYPLSRRVVADHQPIVVQVDDASADPAEAAWMAAQEVESLLMVPLVARDQVIGLLELMEMHRPRTFSPAELRLVQTLANQTAAALENARLYDEARRRSRELALLNRVIAATAEVGEEIEPVLEVVCRELALAFEVPQAAAALYNKEKTEAVVVAEYLAPGRPPSLGERLPVAGNPASQHLLTRKTPLVLGDAQTDPRQAPIHDLLRRRGTVSLLLLPLVVEGDVVGSLGVDAIEPRAFSADEVNLAWRVAEQLSGVLARARLRTERRQLEEQFRQAQKMEAIGRLAGGVAHDFNNLLTVIHLSTRLLERKLEPENPLAVHVQRIQEAGQRATNLTKQLLAFSRREIVEPKVLDLNQVLRDLDKMLRRLIREDIEPSTILADGLWPVKIDPTQVEQVIVNLAVNARDAMPGGGKLTIETANMVFDAHYAAHHLEVEPGEYVMLAVSDTGTGMSDEVKAHLFEPFFTTKEKGEGTGLGLATVFGIVKQNTGHIWVYSEVGQGTTFKIYLPRVVEGAQTLSDRPTEGAVPPARGAETLLLVEDEADVRELVGDILAAQGYRVLAAQDGVEALQVAQDHAGPIHLLLTDVVMPRLSGKALADQLQSSRPEMRVLFTSGYTDNAIVHHGVLDEGLRFLSKPFELEALARKVRDVLDDTH